MKSRKICRKSRGVYLDNLQAWGGYAPYLFCPVGRDRPVYTLTLLPLTCEPVVYAGSGKAKENRERLSLPALDGID
jgi:hypothetical protein